MHAKSYKSLNDVLKNVTNSKLKADVMLKSGNLPFASQKGRMWLKINKFHFTQWKTTEELKISLKGSLYNTILKYDLKTRLAAIDGVSGDTGVNLQHRYVTCPPWHRPPLPFRFYYSNKNYFVQLKDTTIKTERSCSMPRTERTRVLHHSSLGLHCRCWPDQISLQD